MLLCPLPTSLPGLSWRRRPQPDPVGPAASCISTDAGEPRAHGQPRPAKLHQLCATDPLTADISSGPWPLGLRPSCTVATEAQTGPGFLKPTQESSMDPWGPGRGFQPHSPATQPTALKRDFILKLLKRTEMLHVAACRGKGDRGLARGLHFLPTQNTVEGLCPPVCRHLCVCGVCKREREVGKIQSDKSVVCVAGRVHPSVKRQAGFVGPTVGSWNPGRFCNCVMASWPARAGARRVRALLQARGSRSFFLKAPHPWNLPIPLESSPLQTKRQAPYLGITPASTQAETYKREPSPWWGRVSELWLGGR
jgi:hypothetical protein